MEWIVASDVNEETWRQLLEYANSDIALETIEQRHGTATSGSLRSNYKKQAMQLRASLLQAKEYFDAATNSTIITSPNHLFYGMVSLASAMMLVLGDGNYSLDQLRGDTKNRNHGLDFTTNATSKTSSADLEILNLSRVSIRAHGHFVNWYSVLPIQSEISGPISVKKDGLNYTAIGVIGYDAWEPLERLGKNSLTLLQIAKHLPDLTQDLLRFKASESVSRVSFSANKTNNDFTLEWRIHGAQSASDLNSILEKFRVAPSYIDVFSWTLSESACLVKLKAERVEAHWPTIRKTRHDESYIFSHYLRTHEIVDAYRAGFGLSMLSRYFPDLWYSCLESNCRSAKIVELMVNALLQKFPLLTLSILRGRETVISTFKPPWRK